VRYFVALRGQTYPTTCLLYYIEREPAEAWMIEDNQEAASGYNARSCHVSLAPATGTYEMLTGGHDGHIWRLNQASRNDDGAGYYGGFRTPPDSFGDYRTAFDDPSMCRAHAPCANVDRREYGAESVRRETGRRGRAAG